MSGFAPIPAPPEVPAIVPPAVVPARYLRTLEYDPGGYAPSSSFGTSTLAGRDSDLLLGDLLFHSPHTLGARALSMGISCNSCHPNGATHRDLSLPGLSDRAGNVDVSSSFFRAERDDGGFDPVTIP
jgi:hypothetical protein